MTTPTANRFDAGTQASPANKSSGESFAKENPTKSNAIEIPSISLPKGGGALKGIDEKFQVNPSNGTAGYSIPLPLTPGRNGFTPALSLSYNSGSGNSAFGLGWDIGLPAIQRKPDKKLPRYREVPEEDIFMFSGAEDLVPYLTKTDKGWESQERNINGCQVKRYRPRIEGSFSKIEKITHKDHGVYWKVTTRENVATIFGRKKTCRIANPEDETRIFKWLPEFSFDDKGSWMIYEYKEDGNISPDRRELIPDELHEENRKNGNALFTNQYLKRISYGNTVPYYLEAGKAFDPQEPINTEHFFEVVFDYGDHDKARPASEDIKGFSLESYRADAFSNFHAGFEIRTARLCQRVLMFHHFKEEKQPDGSDFGMDYLVKSIDLAYAASSINNSGITEVTYLESITQSGYIRKEPGSDYSKKSLPPLQFIYQHLVWNTEIREVNEESLVNAPVGLANNYQWVDFYGEGVSGIFTEQNAGWYYKSNMGVDENGELQLAPARIIAPKPSFTGINSGVLQLQDLDANGEKQLVVHSPEIKGFFQLTDNNDWEPFRAFLEVANIDLRDPYVRMIDLNGDGVPELVMTEENVFVWYVCEGKKGYGAAEFASKPFDEDQGPALVFAESLQTIFLADMSGDGMTDIVRIRNGEVCYWPNMGYGKFGAKINMGNAPVFDEPEQFNPEHIHLADISGTGATDILYTGKNKCTAWLNLSGNKWNDGCEIETFPPIQHKGRLSVIDLLGTGTSSMVWSSDLPGDAPSPLRYIDLMSSKKPHVMVKHINNMGRETTVEYRSSTWFYLQDKKTGKPWITKLPFPVQVVVATTIEEKITNVKFVAQYSYHHGYYDHTEKEFRGFGRVEQLDTEKYDNWKLNAAGTSLENSEPLFQQPVLTKTWFHTGAFRDKEKLLNQFEGEYWYHEYNKMASEKGFSAAPGEPVLPEAQLTAAITVGDKNIIDNLSANEWREALRACKGTTLRQEVFALDAPLPGATDEQLKRQLTPYSVATHNCNIQLLQPRRDNPFAVFIATESESIQIHYERNAGDPRTAHTLNVVIDDLGNVREMASVVYKRPIADNSLPELTRAAQNETTIIYTKSEFTSDANDTEDAYRLRLPSEIQAFELKSGRVSDTFYSLRDFTNILDEANSAIALYHEWDKEPSAGKMQKRLIEHIRTNYLKNDLSGALGLGLLESMALPFENYQLAYTPELLDNIYGEKADAKKLADLMQEGKFIHSLDEKGKEDASWWIGSGTIKFIEETENLKTAQDRFYVPVSYTDPFGSTTKVHHYANYALFIDQTEDELGNQTLVERFNFRTLSPQRMRDVNNNISEVINDELGMVKAMALLGKGNEADDLDGLTEFTEAAEARLVNEFFDLPAAAGGVADSNAIRLKANVLLQHATARFVYDLDAYANGKPVVVASILREEHFTRNNNSPLQISFEYSDGSGKVVMKKVQAKPGRALKGNGDGTATSVDTTPLLRWIGNGRTVLNNKGNPVKQYEPYFSVTPAYEDAKELVETGVTPVMYYDAPGRLIKTIMPDGTLSRTEFDAWKQSVYDQNDMVLDDECTWYKNRINHLIDGDLIKAGKDPEKEKGAAEKAAKHAGTPTVQHFDTLGRVVLQVEHNRDLATNADDFLKTKIRLDIEGNARSVIDAREIPENNMVGNVVMEYKYDMLGHRVYQKSLDAGQRWLLMNVMGNPLRTWDERHHEFQYAYDRLHRPLSSTVIRNAADGVEDGDVEKQTQLNNIFDRIIYGEELLTNEPRASLQQKNLLGKPFKHFDTGGLLLTPEYDFKGQPRSTARKLYKDYKSVVNWTNANLSAGLEEDEFSVSSDTDALGRITQQTAPDGSVITPSYNESGLLNSETVLHKDPAATTVYILDIDYNEKGQRNKILYGNNVTTKFSYDEETFRLKHLETRKQNNELLQDLYYTYDPVGNIIFIEDKAIPISFFANSVIEPISEYTYDALYRLKEATGRENTAALAFGKTDNKDDAAFIVSQNAGNPMAVWDYIQKYQYDKAGNITQVDHKIKNQGTVNGWTRDYTYETNNNRLINTTVGQGGNTFVYPYPHHSKHGFITQMPHLDEMGWNFKEELGKTIRQKVNPGNGTAETTWYQYDGQGQRLRKITENSALQGAAPTKRDERIYIGGYELYKKPVGNNELRRISLSLMDKDHRFVMIETRNDVDDGTEKKLVRYQLHNHLGSACLELNNAPDPQVISYEEYHPYGTTAYQAINRTIKSAAKRYRYTGMERDEETGLEYHSARYYVPWLGRWGSCDPIGINAGINIYSYVRSSPTVHSDSLGLDEDGIPLKIKIRDFLTKDWNHDEYKEEKAAKEYRRYMREQAIKANGGYPPPDTIGQGEPIPLRSKHVTPEEIQQQMYEFMFFKEVPKEERFRGFRQGKPVYGLTAEEAFVEFLDTALIFEGLFRPSATSAREIVEQGIAWRSLSKYKVTIWAKTYEQGRLLQVTLKGPMADAADLALKLERPGMLVRVGKAGQNFGQHAERLGKAADLAAQRAGYRPDGPAWMSQEACGPKCLQDARATNTIILPPHYHSPTPAAANVTTGLGLQKAKKSDK